MSSYQPSNMITAEYPGGLQNFDPNKTPQSFPASLGIDALGFAAQKVDLPGFDSTPIQTYAQFIALLDATLPAGYTKTARGLCSDGVNTLYEYSAGTGPIKVLLTSGVHGPELAGCWSIYRWMQEFISPTTATFAALNKLITVSWVPHGNPSSFRTNRKNANLVDLNRNYGFYHAKYLAAHPLTSDANYPGSAPLSEPETQAVKAIIDARSIDLVIDCHNYEVGYSAYEILTGAGSLWTRANRKLWRYASQIHKSVYNSNASSFGSNDVDTNPTLQNWVTHYLQNVLLKPNGLGILLECSRDIDGGDVLGNMPSSAVTKYAGFITTSIFAYLGSMYSLPPPPHYMWSYRRFTDNSAVSVTSGGTLIDTNADTALYWDQSDPGVSGLPRNYVDCPITCKGWLVVRLEGTMEVLSAATGRFQAGVTLDGAAITNGTSESFTTSATVGDRINFSCSYPFFISTVDASYVPRISGTLNKLAGASHNLKRSRIIVEFIAHDGEVNNFTPSF